MSDESVEGNEMVIAVITINAWEDHTTVQS